MSSYRPPYRRNVWPDREAEKREAERKAAEEQKRRMEMNETNFPGLSTARPVNSRDALGGFAQLAQKWAIDDEVDRKMAEYKKFQKAVDNVETNRIQARRAQQSRYERHEEEYEEDLAPAPVTATSGIEDDGGWTEVKRKTRKPKRELTVEEMDERDRQRQQSENASDEFNGHLFESNRHDHDRV